MVHGGFDIDPDDPVNMLDLSAFELTQAAPHSERLKAAAQANILLMSVTWDTSQLEMSPLKREL